MCDFCEDGTRFLTYGEYTKLSDDAGIILISKKFVSDDSEDHDSMITPPSMVLDITYRGRSVYKSETAINYCPFCGQKLRKES